MRNYGGEDISSYADAPSSHRREVTALAQTLWAIGQVVAEREPWVTGQCERLEKNYPGS